MGVLVFVLGLLVAVAAGALSLLTYGEAAGIGVFVAVLVLTFLAMFVLAAVRRILVILFALVLVGALGYGGWQGYQLASAFRGTGGPVDPADPTALASANAKIDTVRDTAGFRIELTEDELEAVVQDGLQTADSPVRSVDLDFIAGDGDKPGAIKFVAEFKKGGFSADGTVGYRIKDGTITTEIRDLNVGVFTVPNAASSALDDVLERVSDLNGTLESQRVTVQSLEITADTIVLIGTQGQGQLLTAQDVLTQFKAQAAALGATHSAPAEQVGRGRVDGLESDGNPMYLALGDSLAANVGVTSARDGYVSRFHTAIEKRDGRQYGLHNLGLPGETSGTMLRGQLDEALDFIKANNVAYVTLDVGANDLLPHLASEDCGASADAPACKSRIDASLATYRANLDVILQRLREAAPGATIIVLQTYNPFSFGFEGVRFEDDTNRIVAQMNGVAAELATKHHMLIADGYSPLQKLATTTTHMSDAEPDIHPLAIGYDVLASALLAAK